MKLPNNYYSSQLNKLGIFDANDFKASSIGVVRIQVSNWQGSTNHMNIDAQCLRDINKALQAMEKRSKND